MNAPDPDRLERRVLALGLSKRDAELTSDVLARAGIECVQGHGAGGLAEELERGAGAVLLAEEAIVAGAGRALARELAGQPPWSDLPVLVLTSQGADSVAASEALENLGNVTLLERPIRVAALSSSVRTALRARARQYQIRAHLAEQERSQETRARLAAIVEFSDEAILSLTFDGSVTSWNAGAERLYGFTAAEMVGQSIDLLVPTDLRAEEHRIRERVRAGEGVTSSTQSRRSRRDGVWNSQAHEHRAKTTTLRTSCWRTCLNILAR
jgi:PAS domain S-box-containing protein